MLQAINTWDDYRSQVREFDAVLEYGKAVVVALPKGPDVSTPLLYGALIFGKLLSHALVLRSLVTDPNGRTAKDFWDLPSLCAVARCVVEAHDAFEYVVGHPVDDAERGMRIALWELHDASRRVKTLAAMGGETWAERAQPDVRRQQEKLLGHPGFAALGADLQAVLRQKIEQGNPPAFHLSHRQRCALSGIDPEWHNAVTMQLLQHLHTLPHAVLQPSRLQPGTPDVLRLTAMPLMFSLPFLVRTLQGLNALLPGRLPQPPSRTARKMAVWRAQATTRLVPSALPA